MKKFEEPIIKVIACTTDVLTASGAEESLYGLNPQSNGYTENNTVVGDGTFTL